MRGESVPPPCWSLGVTIRSLLSDLSSALVNDVAQAGGEDGDEDHERRRRS